MGLSLYADAIKPADDKYYKMKSVWDSCQKAGIAIPEEVDEYFNYKNPDEKGVVISLYDHDCVEERNECELEISVDKLPKDTKFIRFYLD